jgi:hypothetical protein
MGVASRISHQFTIASVSSMPNSSRDMRLSH